MSDEENKSHQQCETKRQKLDVHDDQNLVAGKNQNGGEEQVAVTGPSNAEPSSNASSASLDQH